MFHHSQKDYHVAASEAAKLGRTKMETIIQKGQASAQAVLEQVQSQVPQDMISTASALTVLAPIGTDRFGLMLKGRDPLPLHENAFRQVADKAGVPNKHIDDLLGIKHDADDPWNQELVAHNLNALFQHSTSRHLIRGVQEKGQMEVRGFLSDRFRRLDSRPLLDSFMKACLDIGAVPIDGYALDTRVRMRAVLPFVFEPVDNEVMLWGVQWGNSSLGSH